MGKEVTFCLRELKAILGLCEVSCSVLIRVVSFLYFAPLVRLSKSTDELLNVFLRTGGQPILLSNSNNGCSFILVPPICKPLLNDFFLGSGIFVADVVVATLQEGDEESSAEVQLFLKKPRLF